MCARGSDCIFAITLRCGWSAEQADRPKQDRMRAPAADCDGQAVRTMPAQARCVGVRRVVLSAHGACVLCPCGASHFSVGHVLWRAALSFPGPACNGGGGGESAVLL